MMREDVTTDSHERRQPTHPPVEANAVGEMIGPYKLISVLGEGGFGRIFLAEQTSPVHRRVALKLIRPGMDSKAVIARFEAERQALAMMDHPSVAKVFDGGVTAQGRPFFVMEHVRGEPITRFCELERLDVDARVRLMIEVCAAVQHAHMKGVLHRDLKPSNILVSMIDGEPVPKVIDFGVAKALHHRLSESTLYTEIGQMIGTPEYMSPEQARGSTDIDTRADIYALGAILYELLTGVTPVDLRHSRAAGYAELERAIQQANPAAPSYRLSQLVKTGLPESSRIFDVPSTMKRVKGELDWIVLKCLEKERSRRYDAASALADDLERYLKDEPVLAGPPSAAYRAAKFIRRHRVAVATVAIVVLSLVCGVVAASYGLAKAVRETAAAEVARDESEAVTNFLTQMIQSVQPDESGRDVTVREVLDEWSGRIGKDFADRPLVEARLQHAMGLSYWGLGRLNDAHKHLTAAREIQSAQLGPSDPETLRATVNLASLTLEQGRYAEAEQLLSGAIDDLSRTLGEDNPMTLGAMSNLAVLYSRRGADEEALTMHRRVYELQRRVQGPEHPHTLGAQINLADQLGELGQFDEAASMIQDAVAVWERTHGSENPGTLTALHNLAMVQKNRGLLDDAKVTMRRVVEVRRRVLGDNHLDTLTSLINLGVISAAMGNYADAESAYIDSWNGFRRSLGECHPSTATAMIHVGTILEQQGWPARAEPIVRNLVQAAKAVADCPELPPDELNSLAWFLLYVEPAELRDPNAGLRCALRACEQERALGGGSLWMYLDTLAIAQHQTGSPASALASQREAIRLLPKSGEAYRGEMEQRATEYEQAAAQR